MKYLLKHLKAYKKESILAPLFKMLEALFDLFVPMVVADIINIGILSQDRGYIFRHCAFLVVLALIGISCSFTAQYFAAKASVGCAAGLRHDLYAHIQTLGFSEIDTLGTSTLLTRMTADINQVQNGVNMFLRLFLRSPFIVFGAMIMAFTIHAKIALVFVITIPVLAVIVFGLMRITAPLYKAAQSRLDHILGITRENLTGVRVIRAFGKEQTEIRRFESANEDLTKTQLFVGRISAMMNPMTYVVVNLATIAILQMGAVRVDQGVLLNGDIVALVNYMSQILVELVKLANTVVLLSKAMACLNRVGSVLDTEPGMKFVGTESGKKNAAGNSGNESSQPDTARNAVVFSHVSLTYAGAGEESLTDISFTAKRGETIGVIGGTGSGKSSLVNLIPRFYDATTGTVSVLGKKVEQWDKETLRYTVGIVPQKTRLFAGTIRSNLRWGNPDASEEELWKALEIAQAVEIVKGKPLGLEEPVEQGGRNFSGGQRQRLTIARALVKKPEILILDDSSSALDFATDAALRKALRTLPDTQTVFLVSQRTSSLMHADRILVLEDGQLADQGNHEELLKRCDVYREIHESQFRKGDARG